MGYESLAFTDYLLSSASIFIFFVIFLFATPVVLILLLLSMGRLTNFIIRDIAPLMMKPLIATRWCTLCR